MKRDETETVVRAALALALERDLEPDEALSRAETPDWDSLHHISFLFALEDAFEIELPESSLEAIVDLPTAIDAVVAAQDDENAQP